MASLGLFQARRRVLTLVAAACLLVLPTSAPAQATMDFDVASIKQNKSGFPPAGEMPRSNFPLGPGNMYSPNGGTFSATNQPLWIYLMFAYKMTDHEVVSMRKLLPAWALEEQYDIQARSDRHDATKDEMRLMMRSLLADRLKLAVHHSTEIVPVYNLVLARPGKPGPKLQPHPAADLSCSQSLNPAAPSTPPPPQTVPGGFPVICGGAASVPPSVPGRLAAGYRNVPLSLIALQMTLMGGLDRPVIDQTGLTGNYDYVIEFTPQPPPGVTPSPELDTSGPTFQQALESQVGLKLIPQRAPVDVLIIDHIERPSAN